MTPPPEFNLTTPAAQLLQETADEGNSTRATAFTSLALEKPQSSGTAPAPPRAQVCCPGAVSGFECVLCSLQSGGHLMCF